MKKRLNLFMIMAFAMLFAVVSCQKEELTDFSNSTSTQKVMNGDCIDFEFMDQAQSDSFAAGDVPAMVYTNTGLGPISIFGINPAYGSANAAMIFNSEGASLVDPDLLTGASSTNMAYQGNVLIVSEDPSDPAPDDLDGPGEFDFGFGACGPVSVLSITIIDVEGSEGKPYIEYFGATGNYLGTDSLPTTGNNGVMTVNFANPVSGVDSMHVHLKGSGAIDDICIEKDTPPAGCTHTIGYWKTHAGFGPQADVVTPLLPIWLGTSGGSSSLAVTDRFIARDVLKMKTYGNNKNGITKLYAQLLAAKLSIADGADGAPVATYIADADAFLENNDWNDWNSLSKTMKNQVLTWKRKLDKYNNGLMGVPHCP